MVRMDTVAAGVGILAGLWTVAVFYLDGVAHTCPATGCPPPGLSGVVVPALSVVLVLDSLVCFIGPKSFFYASAVLSAVLAASMLLTPYLEPLILYLTVGLLGLGFVLSVVAARWETKVSEQSHPMNLPVFG